MKTYVVCIDKNFSRTKRLFTLRSCNHSYEYCLKNSYIMGRVILEAGTNENLDLFIFRCKVNGCNPSFIHVHRGNKDLIKIIDLKKNETVYDYEKSQEILNYEDDDKDDIH